MQYTSRYTSPLGEILLAADDIGLTGLWFDGQKYYARGLGEMAVEKALPVFDRAKKWMDIYFSGQEPGFTPPLHLIGSEFQKAVWELLRAIPRGQTVTYGHLAKILAAKRCQAGMSAQAVGGAVGRNPISMIVPCHRVVGADGSLTGYAGGIEKKIYLLELEKAEI